jgi:arylformamidase
MPADIIDLSHSISHGTITYKGLPPPVISDFWSHEYSAQFYEDNTSFHIARIDMVVNTGTYIDVPFHRFKEGNDLSETPIEKFVNLEGICFNFSFENKLGIMPELFSNVDLKNKAVLFHTGWSKKWGQEEYQRNHPFRFFGVPPKIKGAGSFPIRAFAILDH